MAWLFCFIFFIAFNIQAATGDTCKSAVGESESYAVLKRNCYSKYDEPYRPVFYPLTKDEPYITAKATKTCGQNATAVFTGKQVCVSWTYTTNRWSKLIGKHSTKSNIKKCFDKSAIALEVTDYPLYSYQRTTEYKSDYELILVPCKYNTQPTSEPCFPETGESGPAKAAILKRTWCQSYEKTTCFIVLYPIVKGLAFQTSQANKTYGRDVSVMFYGKDVCIAYLYEGYSYSRTYNRHILDQSYCRKRCFTGYKSNQQEKQQGPADPFNPTLKWESDYELVVPSEENGGVNWKVNIVTLAASFFITILH